jgi:hypothetical protein
MGSKLILGRLAGRAEWIHLAQDRVVGGLLWTRWWTLGFWHHGISYQWLRRCCRRYSLLFISHTVKGPDKTRLGDLSPRMKMDVLWDVPPSSHRPVGGGSRHLWDVDSTCTRLHGATTQKTAIFTHNVFFTST